MFCIGTLYIGAFAAFVSVLTGWVLLFKKAPRCGAQVPAAFLSARKL